MEDRKFITVSRPPRELFEDASQTIQDSEEIAAPGQFFDRMEYPESGGIFAWYYDHPFPHPGQPYPAAVDAIQVPKKMIVGTALFLRRHFILAAILFSLPKFITGKLFKSISEFYLDYYVMAALKPHFLAENRYCKAVREIRRAGFKTIQGQKCDEGAKHQLEVLLIMNSTILEWDNAHRYRVQDVAGELDKEAFYKSPSKEILRLMHLQVSRERGWHENKGKYILLGNVLRFILFFSPFCKKFLKDFIRELNIGEVGVSEGDEYHNLMRPDYDIHGWPIEVRQKKWIVIANDYRGKNSGRIQEGMLRKERLQSAAHINAFMEREGGAPFMIFLAVPAGDKSHVKMLETKYSIDNPKLKEAAKAILEGKGQSLENFSKNKDSTG